MAERGGADSIGTGAGAAEELASVRSLNGGDDVLEDVALSKNHTAVGDLEGVARVVVPVVVDGVEKGVARDLGSTTGGLVDVVVLEGDQL